MKAISKVRIIMYVLLALVFALGLGSFSSGAKASVSQVTDGVMTSDQDSVKVAAPRPWTAAEMKAAKPYPLGEVDASSAALSVDVLAGPDGPAGSVAGAAPGKSPAADQLSEDLTAGVQFLGYPYPPPYTRQYVYNISNETKYPFRTIGKLFFTQYGTNYVCSASVIGPNGILTAGHCTHAGNNSSGGWSYNVVFVPAYKNGVAPYGQWTVSTLAVKTSWYSTAEPRTDFGVMKINKKSGHSIGSYTGYLGYAWNFTRVLHWWEIGYPQASPFTGKYMTACQASYAYDGTFGSGSYPPLMTVGCDQTGGTSGGPWVKNFGTGNYANGVNAYRHVGYSQELISPYVNASIASLLNMARGW